MVTTWLPGVDYTEDEVVQLHSIQYKATQTHRSKGESQPPNQCWQELPSSPDLKPKQQEYFREFDHLTPRVPLTPKPLGYNYAKVVFDTIEVEKEQGKRSQFFQKLENNLHRDDHDHD